MPSAATQWRPGQSGNPNGRPKIADVIRGMARLDTPAAYETVRSLMVNAEKSSVRLAAAIMILRLAGAPMSQDSTWNDGESPSPNPKHLTSPSPTPTLLSIAKQPSPSSGDEAS